MPRLDLSAVRPPATPGVYIFRDGRKRPIYIGKAKSLSDRIGSYSQKALPNKTMAMLEAARAIDWIVVESEIEALLCEAAMVRQYKPKYNSALRDDKRFPMILITDEPWPKALKVRRAHKGKGRHFGPFRGATAFHLLELISRRFKLRRCSGPLPDRKRPCLDHDIGRCDAPCVGRITREEYLAGVEDAARLLSGDMASLAGELRAEMESAAAAMDFETAAALRDEVAAIRALSEKQNAERPGREDADAASVAIGSEAAAVILLERRGGVIANCRRYLVEIPVEITAGELIRKTLMEHYSQIAPPRTLLVAEEIALDPEMNLLPGLVAGAAKFAIWSPKRGADRAFLRMAEENAAEELRVQAADRSLTSRNLALGELATLLELDAIPSSIEGFDISTMSGRDTVGACVRFQDGVPRKSGYRLYRIKGRQDSDVDAMAEVLARRSLAKDELPALILIDGGLTQLHAAWKAIAENAAVAQDSMPTVISLAKREETIFTMEGEAISLPRSSHALRLLQQVRDESHRFVRNYHRKVRDRAARDD